MSSLILPRKWTKQPQVTVDVDWSHPIASKLCAVTLPTAGGLRNFAQEGFVETFGKSTNSANAFIKPSSLGLGTDTTIDSIDGFRLHSVANATNTVWEKPSSEATWFALIIRRGNQAGGNSIIFGNNSPDIAPYSGWAFQDASGTGTLRSACAAGGVANSLLSGTLTNNTPLFLVGRYNGALIESWINGVKTTGSTEATGNISYPNTSNRGPSLGNYYDYSLDGRSFNGQAFLAGLSDEALTDSEIAELSANPWQIFKRKPQTLYFDVGGGHALTATSVESATEVSSPPLGQTHALAATNVESASEVTAPALTQSHALTAVSVESASEVTAPALGLSHVLTATSVESASEVSAPALAQVHAIAAVSVESTTELTAPVIGQAHALSPNSVESAAEVTAPVLTENAAGVHNLTATSVESATEVTAPVLGQVHALAPSGVESATELSAPTLAQIHVLFPNSVESVSEVSAPTLSTGFALTPVSVESATEVTAPTLAQVHVLYPASVESASEVSAPAIGQVHALTAVGVESASELTAPVLAEGGLLIGTPGRIITRAARNLTIARAARNLTIARAARNWRISA